MPTIEITDEQHDRIKTLREELAAKHSTQYTSVTLIDVVSYLLDLCEAIDDPQQEADVQEGEPTADETSTNTKTPTAANHSFPRDKLEARLEERNLRYSESDPDMPMDLYEIATVYDVSGRSNMTKQELITAILDAAETLYTDPFAPVDIESPFAGKESKAVDTAAVPDTDSGDTSDSDTDTEVSTHADETGDDEQLDAMLSLLETHSDKWSSADGDARYEIELPDGTIESARTKDDIRATLFKHYT